MGLRHRRGFIAAVAGLIASQLAVGPVLAQSASPQPKLVVLVVPATPAAQENAGRVDYVARQAVSRSGRFDIVRLIDALDAENADARERRVTDGSAALESARTANNELDSNKAIAEADRAMKAFSDSDLTQHMKELVGAWIFKIAALIGNGEDKAAQMEMDKLLAVAPNAEFSRDLFPPDDLAYAEKIRKQYAKAEQSMQVTTTPTGAEVFVDGRFQGISPVTVKGLPAGDHFVTVKAPGYLLAQQKSQPGPVEIALEKAEAYPRYAALVQKVVKDPDGPQRDEAAKEFGKWIGVDQVLLAIVDQPTGAQQLRLTVLRLDPKDGHNLGYAQERMPASGDGLLQSADGVVTSVLSRDEPRRNGPVTHYVDPNGSWKKTAGYALLGVGAAAVVSGVVFGIAASAKQAQFHNAVQTDVGTTGIKSTGRTFAVVADVSYLTGLIAAGAGSYLTFIEPKLKTHSPPTAPAPEKPAKPAEKKAEPAKAVTKPEEKKPAEEKKLEEKKPEEPPKKKDSEKRRKSEDEDDLRYY